MIKNVLSYNSVQYYCALFCHSYIYFIIKGLKEIYTLKTKKTM